MNCSMVFARLRQYAPHLIHASLGPPESSPKRHLDRFSRFCRLTIMTDKPTDHARYSACNNRSYVRKTAMRPNNNNMWSKYLDNRPHRRRIWTLQWYSPGCASVHPVHLIQCMLPWAHPSPNAKQRLDPCSRFCTANGTKSVPIHCNGPPLSPQNCPFSSVDVDPI